MTDEFDEVIQTIISFKDTVDGLGRQLSGIADAISELDSAVEHFRIRQDEFMELLADATNRIDRLEAHDDADREPTDVQGSE